MTAAQLAPEDHPWLADARLQTVLDALEADGGGARIVGGAIRNAVLGEPVGDIDIATTETPERAMALCAKAGLRSMPTGLAHGTVTVLATSSEGTKSFEVTTLRRDLLTDGRHAEVAFTDDWAQDAARRDFTMNALYCDRSGKVFDPLNGYQDLITKRIRFVGDPLARVREDYLRILRLFRFAARYGPQDIDEPSLSACVTERDGLDKLSAERIRQEWFRLIVGKWAVPVVEIMADTGILPYVIGQEISVDALSRLAETESFLRLAPDPLLRSFNLSSARRTIVPWLRDHLRLTNAERDRLEQLVAAGRVTPGLREKERRAVLYRLGPETFRDAVLTTWCREPVAPDNAVWRELFSLADEWPIPTFPLRGNDLVELGIPPGPEIGLLLEALQDLWIASDFSENKQALLSRIPALRRGT